MTGQLVVLALWIAILTGGSYLPYLPHGRLHLSVPDATTSLLSVLWQVQATSVGLVFTVVVFVFGLLPQGRGGLTYREFLRRTWALPLTMFNVASLLFNGMVLLGIGHQVQPVGTAPGHGWAVTMASVAALASIATIVVLLVRTVRAVNPVTAANLQREYQRAAVALSARDELTEIESLRIMNADTWPFTFIASYPGPGPGRTIRVAGPGQGVVRDVSLWRLSLLKQVASWMRHSDPVVHAWPGRPVAAGTPLVSSDPSTGWLGYWWARRCVRVRAVPSDQLGDALTALYGETLDQIRAGRAAEAIDGMRALGGLLELLWQAYAAHGRKYGPETSRPIMLYRRGAGERIGELLDDLLRAAAVSADDTIRREATALPSAMARDAVSREEPYAVPQATRHLEAVYITVVSELSEGGQRDLPRTELARSRLDAPFRSLLSFVNYYLGQAIDQAAVGGTTGWDGRPLPLTEFLISQLTTANEAILRILRHAVQYRDSATVSRVLDAWKMPELLLAKNFIQRVGGKSAATASGTDTPQSLAQSLADAEANLNAMLFRLLVTALDTDRAARQTVPPHGPQTPSGADPATDAILDRLPDGRLWHILDRAVQTSSGDWRWQMTSDGIIPAGVVITRPVDTISPLLEAFALAAVARPRLVAGSDPDHRLALDRGPALRTTVDKVLAEQTPWLERHGCPQDDAGRYAADLKARLEQAEHDARRHLEEEIRESPVLPAAEDELRREAQEAFRDSDITGALFTWAGKLGPGTGPLAVKRVTLTCPRSSFTAIGYGDGAMASHGHRLGRQLAAMALGQLTTAALQAGQERRVRREDIAGAVHDAIGEVSSAPPAGTGRRASGIQTVVLIPDSWDLKTGLEIAGTGHPDRLEAARSKVIRKLGLEGEGLVAQIAGAIDGVPVIAVTVHARDQEGWVLVVNLARFGELRRGTSGGALPVEPELVLFQPQDPLRAVPGGSIAPETSHVADSQPNLLQVQVALSLSTDVTVSDPCAIRVIRIGQAAPDTV